MQRDLLDGALLDQSCHLLVDEGVVEGSLRGGREALLRERKGQLGREGGIVTLHGLKQLRGCL